MPVPFVNLRPALDATEPAWRANLDRLFARMQFILGEQLTEFEREFATALGAKSAIGVANGTAAIELCLRDAGARGDVFTSGLTAPFTAVAIRAAGCRPRFADIDDDTLQIDAADLGNRITRATSAVVPVHLYGQPCDLGAIRKLGKPVIQDACQAHGATYAGKPLSAHSDYVAYSFYPTKNLGALGDGGAILTNRATIARRLSEIRDGGRRGDQISHTTGMNSRLDEMQCCYLRAFLTRLDEWNQRRAEIARAYDTALANCPGVRLVKRTGESVNHLYVIRADRREALRKFLSRNEIGTAIHYPVPLHLHPAFSDCNLKRGDLPIAERATKEILSLPIWPHLDIESVHQVSEVIHRFYR